MSVQTSGHIIRDKTNKDKETKRFFPNTEIRNVAYEKTKDILKHLKLLENVLKYLMQENNSRCCIE